MRAVLEESAPMVAEKLTIFPGTGLPPEVSRALMVYCPEPSAGIGPAGEWFNPSEYTVTRTESEAVPR